LITLDNDFSNIFAYPPEIFEGIIVLRVEKCFSLNWIVQQVLITPHKNYYGAILHYSIPFYVFFKQRNFKDRHRYAIYGQIALMFFLFRVNIFKLTLVGNVNCFCRGNYYG